VSASIGLHWAGLAPAGTLVTTGLLAAAFVWAGSRCLPGGERAAARDLARGAADRLRRRRPATTPPASAPGGDG